MECLGENCPKKKTVHLTEIINGEMAEMHLCEDCPKLKKLQMNQDFGLAGMLADFVDLAQPTQHQEGPGAIACPKCGMEYEDFRKYGRLGCSHCYEAFKKPMNILLKNIHGSNQHRGKAPANIRSYEAKAVIEKTNSSQIDPIQPVEDLKQGVTEKVLSKEEQIEQLKQQMTHAIEQQDFEKAAEIRDQIKEFTE